MNVNLAFSVLSFCLLHGLGLRKSSYQGCIFSPFNSIGFIPKQILLILLYVPFFPLTHSLNFVGCVKCKSKVNTGARAINDLMTGEGKLVWTHTYRISHNDRIQNETPERITSIKFLHVNTYVAPPGSWLLQIQIRIHPSIICTHLIIRTTHESLTINK